jgi:hypothetical protein
MPLESIAHTEPEGEIVPKHHCYATARATIEPLTVGQGFSPAITGQCERVKEWRR